MSLRTVAALAPALAVALTGCVPYLSAKTPHTTAVATGEPVAVVDDVKVWTTTSKEKVGETEYKDENGHVFAKADTYQDKTQVHTMKVWYPFQGNEQLSDEEFFRITNEQRALDDTQQMHANAAKWNKRGGYTAIGGVIGAVAGFLVPNVTVATILRLGGGLAISGGMGMMYWGARQMEPEVHAVDRSIAERAAQQYNQQLGGGGRTIGVSMQKSF
jgi:hypothetical protein